MQLNDYTRYRNSGRMSIMETRHYYLASTDFIRSTLTQGAGIVFDKVADAIGLERFIVIDKDKCETR